jgi:UDP-2,4-diacetamido-2,4,6-trideoxy-beta-L-altropyranose hydrolase
MTLQIAFRTEASLQMGGGHVMRCLTLADALKAQGAQCHFISRAHPGHLMEVIRQRGHVINSLVAPVQQAQAVIRNGSTTGQDWQPNQQHEPAHAAWLGNTWQTDAQETIAVLASVQPDWLVVDHYALDQRWEEALVAHYRQLLVIDDLADRPHRCDLLIDQNLGRQTQDYAALVPTHCEVLTGPHYALLRPEFAALRPYSLHRRQAQPALRQLLITMGGVDQPNATKQVLQALKTCALPQACRITVVMGLTAPWLQDVQELASQMPWPTEVVVNVNDMAQRMADSDLAIGAAGGTSWERCCLGLPTLMVVLAENQQPGAQATEAAHAARLIGAVSDIATQLPLAVAELIESERQRRMSLAASAITDGRGVDKILKAMGVINA